MMSIELVSTASSASDVAPAALDRKAHRRHGPQADLHPEQGDDADRQQPLDTRRKLRLREAR